MRFRGRGAPALAAGCSLVAVGCGDDDSADAPLTVSAASSLTEAFETYGEAIEGEEKFSFAGSDELAAQIRQGAKPDVFASANTTLPDELFAEDLIDTPVAFTRNQLVLAIPKGETSITEVGDLAEPGLDIVIGAEGVPVGDYTRETLAKLPAAENEAILANVRSEEPEVKGIVGKLATGAADAGFVYASDVDATADDIEGIELPDDLEPVVTYGVAVVKGAPEPERAQEFIDGLLSGDGAEALADSDFLPPPE